MTRYEHFLDKKVKANKIAEGLLPIICEVITSCDIDMVQLLMKYQGVDEPIAQEYPIQGSCTALYYAIYECEIVSEGASKNCEEVEVGKNKSLEKDFDMVKMLLNEGARIDLAYAYCLTPLHVAAKIHHVILLQVLFAHQKHNNDININVTDKEGKTPLHYAIEYNYVDNVKFLLEKGADVNKADMHNETPLFMAVRHGQADIVKLLLEHGADPNLSPQIKISSLQQWAEDQGPDVKKNLNALIDDKTSEYAMKKTSLTFFHDVTKISITPLEIAEVFGQHAVTALLQQTLYNQDKQNNKKLRTS